VSAGGVGIAERERRVEVNQSVGVREQPRCMLGGDAVVQRRRAVVTGKAQVLGDERGVLFCAGALRQDGPDAAVQQAPAREARLGVDQRAQLLV